MNKKVILVSLITALVVVGVTTTLIQQSSGQATGSTYVGPSTNFPDNGPVATPIDQGGILQKLGGAIDFSGMPSVAAPLQFRSGQGIIFTSNSSSSALDIVGGSFKIATFGKGIIFPDGTPQTSAGDTIFGLGKLCQAVGSTSKNTVNAPDAWTATDCGTFATAVGASSYQLGCVLQSGTSFGVSSGVTPDPNCGWSSSCSGTGPYYPYAPTGCATPQKVFAGANQTSVTSGTTGVVFTSAWHTDVCTPQDLVICGSGPCYIQPTCTFSCFSSNPLYATSFNCGEYLYDDAINPTTQELCGTGNVYQVYCR